MLSGSFDFVARSTPKVLFARVRLVSYAEVKVLCASVRLESDIFAVHLH